MMAYRAVCSGRCRREVGVDRVVANEVAVNEGSDLETCKLYYFQGVWGERIGILIMISQFPRFQRKILAASIASCILTGFSTAAHAQDGTLLEEVVVVGIRGSLVKSMDIKRNSFGVVDAISAEDIGRFPDTNLAESLQRIPGVSISRVNGEGSRVTIRGFAGGGNMVTLNGRMMPAADVYGGVGPGANNTPTRAFNFANLASESVSSVEVYKTGKATMSTGGIGGTINILTMRPFDHPGLQTTLAGKALMDTSNSVGDDVTPEVSGLLSWTNDDSNLGISLSGSYQRRDSSASSATVNNWIPGIWGQDNWFSFAPDVLIENAPNEGDLYARPQDIRYAHSDRERTRTNGQLTLQWAPTDAITTTLDYTYAENKLLERRGESTAWMINFNSVDHVIFDNDANIKTPVYIHETFALKDYGNEQQLREQTNTLKSLGFNLEWSVTDSFSIYFDAHDSSMDSLPTGPGQVGSITATIGAPVMTTQSLDYSGDLPLFNFELDDCIRGNCNGIHDAGDIGSQVVRLFYADQQTDITQFRLDGAFDFDDGRFQFGVETRAMEMRAKGSMRYMNMGGWGIANVADFSADLIEMFNFSDFDDYDASASFQGGVKGNAEDITQSLIDTYGTPENGYVLEYNPDFDYRNRVQEDTSAIYFQLAYNGHLGHMETSLLAGLRYEKTDVTSNSLLLIPGYMAWNGIQLRTHYLPGTEEVQFPAKADYDNLLPSVDFDIKLKEYLKARFSYSLTIARAPYTALQSSIGNFGGGGTLFNNSSLRGASAFNPGLLPLESKNFDLSLEWYYNDAAYVSVGVFGKRVKNFLGFGRIDETHFGLRDITGGPRIEAAAIALEDAGFPTDDKSLFAMMAILDNPDDFPGGASEYSGDLEQIAYLQENYEIIPDANDPLIIFSTSRPINNKEADIYGAEIAWQHFFGSSGFGILANYTIVRGDIDYDVGADPSESQFALPGLSDTANLVGIYEKHNFHVRVAYNWRDEFLSSTQVGNFENPGYVEAYSQIDVNISYDINDRFVVFAEGINISEGSRRDHGRSERQVQYLEDLGARYLLGLRYTY